MLRWSHSYVIPFKDPHVGGPLLTHIGKKIYFIPKYTGWRVANVSKYHMVVFDTETREFSHIESNYYGTNILEVVALINHNGVIYMWAEEEPNERFDRTLYRLDMDKLIWVKGITITLRGAISNIVFSQNEMMVLLEEDKLNLVKVNLDTDAVIRKVLDDYSGYDLDIGIKHEGKQYFVKHIDYTYRTVNLFENEKYTEISRERYGRTIIVTNDGDRDVERMEGGHLLEGGFGEGVLYNNTVHPEVRLHLYMEKFDFKAMKWNGQNVEACYPRMHLEQISGSCEIDGKVYATICASGHLLKVLELQPSLQTVCLFNLVDRILDLDVDTDREKFEKLEKKLPEHLRLELHAMLDWRRVIVEKQKIREKNIELQKRNEDEARKQLETTRRSEPPKKATRTVFETSDSE